MKPAVLSKLCLAGFGVGMLLSAVLFVLKNHASFSPWITSGAVNIPTYMAGNDERLAIIENSETAVVVLDSDGSCLYRVKARRGSDHSFSIATFAALDDYNNLYVLDARFRGSQGRNTERVLKYSPSGQFIGELYTYSYENKDFIVTKGKIAGMSWFEDVLYLVRLDNDGFWLEQIQTLGQDKTEGSFTHPNASCDLVYFNIDAGNRLLTAATKAGEIKQYDFSGTLVFTMPPEGASKPWDAVSAGKDSIVYSDIFNAEIILLDKKTGNKTRLCTVPPQGKPYYRINTWKDKICAASPDNILILDETFEKEIIDTYTRKTVHLRFIWFILFVLDTAAFLTALTALCMIIKFFFNNAVKRIIVIAFSIAFGSILASAFVINEMWDLYYTKTHKNLENISILMAADVDTDLLSSLLVPAEYENKEYLKLKEKLETRFSKMSWDDEGVYQIIWQQRDGRVYLMYDTESSAGILYPFAKYEGSIYQKVTETKTFHRIFEITSEGSWLSAIGPLFDKDGNVAALIETGCDLSITKERIRSMVVQTVLTIAASSIALLLLVIELILILEVHKKNKKTIRGNKPLVFRPEFLRVLNFLMFTACNSAAAILPIYAIDLYQPILGLPKEVAVTLPFMADMLFSALALLLIPLVLEKAGVKRLFFGASFFFIVSYALCFAAQNILHITIAYALIGFSGGTMLLIINTVIGVQKDTQDIHRGFAHINSSTLAGKSVGAVSGSILAQYFPYRIVFIFALLFSLLLFIGIIFSLYSKAVQYLYKVQYTREVKKDTPKFSLLHFIFRPIVFCSLFLLLTPYTISLNFTEYFMPLYGLTSGLTESNIGQLILLSGLLAILFGVALCEYARKKFPPRLIIAASLLLNLGSIYLFSLRPSVMTLTIVIVLLSVANIFVLPSIQTYYTVLYQNDTVSAAQAVGVYYAMENLSLAAGPVVFSYIWAGNMVLGMKLLAGVLCACLGIFLLVSSLTWLCTRKARFFHPAG